jgi:hypothetical protein
MLLDIVNVGGGPTPDKPSITLSVPGDLNLLNSFFKHAMNHGKVEELSL